MKRENFAGKSHIVGYHTQEFRSFSTSLRDPIKCTANDAWLGMGYYFWTEEEFAHYWGQDFKMNTGAYDIYRAYLNCENCLNTVFDEGDYFFFVEQIEETIQHFRLKGTEPTLDEVNRFLADNIWQEIGFEGIMFDDKPNNPKNKNRIYSSIPRLYYKKRIQIVLFNLSDVREFTPYLVNQK